MRSFFLACFFVCLVISSTAAQEKPPVNAANPFKQLLDLPAPALFQEKYSPLINELKNPPETESYEGDRVPPDDAPINVLLNFWSMENRMTSAAPRRRNIKPSEKTVERILEFCEEYSPGYLAAFFGVLPDDEKTIAGVKRIYDNLPKDETGEYSARSLKTWLTYNNAYFVDELAARAEKVGNKNRYVTNHTELLALARIDWNRAAPILERLVGDSSQPVSQTLAHWVYYAHANREGDEADVTRYRRLLQETLENRDLQPTGTPHVFWAAVYDYKTKETALGRYDTKTFALQPVVRLPQIKLSSMDIRVDEKEAKIYFVYAGHLLSVPLPAPQK